MRYANPSAIRLLLVAVLALAIVGCDALTDGYDEDPNANTEARGDLLFNGASVGVIMFQESNLARIASIFANQTSGEDRQYARMNRYQVNSSDFDNMWSAGYADVLNELGQAKQQARATNKTVLLNLSKILEAQTVGTFAALFGDVPFSEVNEGRDNLNPQFDAQAEIYTAIQDSLTDAVAALTAHVNDPDAPSFNLAFGDPELDPYYGGDLARWIELANTLQARFYLHTGDYEDAVTAAEAGISSPEGNMVARHGTAFAVDANLWWNFAIQRGGYLQAGDAYAPRLLDAEAEAYRGNDKTDETARFLSYYGGFGNSTYNIEFAPAFGGAAGDTDYPIVRYAENELIRAEALLQSEGAAGFDEALTALNNARAANGAYYETLAEATYGDLGDDFYQAYEAPDFEGGGIAANVPEGVSATPENALLTEVLEEKYLSLIGNLEAFNDVRRTDNFLNIPLKEGASNLPQRFPYAQIELSANDNAPEPPSLAMPTPVNEALSYSAVN